MQVNPFWPTFVVDPRKIDDAWRPPFAEALQAVAAEFDRRFPRTGSSWPPGADWRRRQPLWLVGSLSGGTGTTSFLGTLFRRIEGRAVPIYVRPFRNPLGPWKALLRTVGEELLLPDRPRAVHRWPEEPSRIQVFANDVLGALASRLVHQGKIRDSRLRSAVRFLRRHPSKVLLEGLVPEWVQWLRQEFARILPAAEELLSELGPWEGELPNWLWAIHGLAVRTEDRVVQDACRRWVFGEPLDWAQAMRANLSVATADGGEAFSDKERLCRGRVGDLLRLSALSKPFLLSFDDADAWGGEPELASAAGLLLEELQEASPAFLLLAARLGRWDATVLPHWSEKQRSLLSPPLLLREIEKTEAADFLEARLSGHEGRRGIARPDWREEIYQNRSALPVRSLLLSCTLRWNEEHSLAEESSALVARWLREATLQWATVAPTLPFRWIAEWALLPADPPADFGWQREATPFSAPLCARGTRAETDLWLFAHPPAVGGGSPALLSLLEGATMRAKERGRALEALALAFEWEEPAIPRNLSEKGLPGLSLRRFSPEETLGLAAALSLAFCFRGEREFPSVEGAARQRAEEILSSWRAGLSAPASPSPSAPRIKALSLPLIEAVRDAVRARRAIRLDALRQRLPGQVGREQIFSAAGILSEVQVRTGPSLEPIFCWQP